MKTYIAGPMTGKDDWNFPAFHAAAKELRARGDLVVNPAELDEADEVLPGERPWDWYLRRDLKEMLQCDAVYALEGWEESKGAQLEIYVANELGIPVEFQVETLPNILQEANYVVHGQRRNEYGHPIDNHQRTANLWATYLRISITPVDVCFLNILQKISRGMNKLTRDTLVDIAGYAANIEMIQKKRGHL